MLPGAPMPSQALDADQDLQLWKEVSIVGKLVQPCLGKTLGCGVRAGNVCGNLLLLEQGYKIKKKSVLVLAMVTPHSPLFL